MKVKIIEDKTIEDNQINITVKSITPEIQKWIEELENKSIIGYRREKEYHIKVKNIIFFETDLNTVFAHTNDSYYETKYRLYELEEMLPNYFCRISKSSIINMKEISSLDSKITSSRTAYFHNSQKFTFISRKYYPILKEKLAERSY